MMKLSSIHPLERLRKEQQLSQRALAQVLLCGDDTISSAENGKQIGRKMIDRILDWSAQVNGHLKRKDFIEAPPRRGNGKGIKAARKSSKAQGRKRKGPAQARVGR